jgi:hypothetical protein
VLLLLLLLSLFLLDQLLLLGEFDDRRRLLRLLGLLQTDERDVRHFWVDTAGHYQVDDATSPLQDANGRLVRDGRFQHLSVNRQDLIALGQSTISATRKRKEKNTKSNQILKGIRRVDSCVSTNEEKTIVFHQVLHLCIYQHTQPPSISRKKKKNPSLTLPSGLSIPLYFVLLSFFLPLCLWLRRKRKNDIFFFFFS